MHCIHSDTETSRMLQNALDVLDYTISGASHVGTTASYIETYVSNNDCHFLMHRVFVNAKGSGQYSTKG